MRVRAAVFAAAMAAAMVVAEPACAENYRQVGTIPIPGTPITAFATMAIDQASGLGYLADKDNKAVVVFNTKTDRYVSRISGFVGLRRPGTTAGPNGLAIVNGGAELWVSDGDSTIKVVDLRSNSIMATISTGGRRRANGMAYDSDDGILLVVNSNDDPPFINLISTKPERKVLAKLPVPESGANLERSAYHARSGMFYTAIPVLRADQSKGILAQTDAKAGKIVKLHILEGCHPHSLQIVSASTIFLGCSSAHGPNGRPGGDMAVFDIPSGKIVMRVPALGGNGGSTLVRELARYYHSTTAAMLMVVDTKTAKPVQKIKTWRGARSVGVSLANRRIYLATSAKSGPCGGCIAVFAAE